MDGTTKLVISHRVGKRELLLAKGLMVDVRQRVTGHPLIVTDGLVFYFDAVQQYFGRFGCDFAQLVKVVKEGGARIHEGYTTPKLVTCKPYPLFGNPDRVKISTSYIERQNWTIRTFMRRLTRLSNGFSRKLENLKAATALHFAHYNFCRVHTSLRVTPAMEANVTDHVWGVEALLPN